MQPVEHIIPILSIEQVTHDVKQFRCVKPVNYEFVPGQATEVSINNEKWKNEKRPFTFTSLNESPYLEFTIKIYSDHDGLTNALNTLKQGDEIIVSDTWGAIEYKGPGYFIAGGAGITPFIAILRQLKKDNSLDGNTLFFSNKTEADIILEDELSSMLGTNAVFVISDEISARYHSGYIDEDFLKQHVPDFSRNFYVCGPPKMTKALQQILTTFGANPDSVVFEK